MMPSTVPLLQPRLLAALLLAGCAATGPPPPVAPRERAGEPLPRPVHGGHAGFIASWSEDHEEDSEARLRSALMGGNPEAALHAAINLPATTLSLAEIRRQMVILVRHARTCFTWAGAKDGYRWVTGLHSLGSPEVMALYAIAVAEDPDGTAAGPPEDFHRVTTQDHLPALADLLVPAQGDVFQQMFWNFRLLADNTDRHRDRVERTLHYVRAALLAEAEEKPVQVPIPVPVESPEPGSPESLRLLVRAPWGIGDEPIQGCFFLPANWVERWLRTLHAGPADLPFLEEVAWKSPFDGRHEKRRAWAARTIAAIGGPGAERILKALEEDGWKVRDWLKQDVEVTPGPEAFTAAEARVLAEAWARDPAKAENLQDASVWESLLLIEAAAPEALDALLRAWAAGATPDCGADIAALRIRRGDPAAVGVYLDRPDASREDYWRIGRSKDPRVRAHLEGIVKFGAFDHGCAMAGLAAWHGLPEPLVESMVGSDPLADPILAGRPGESLLLLAEEGDFPEDRIGRLGLLGEASRPILDKYRRERHLGLYWPATAGLAIAGDGAAREEFLALLREDRIGIWDEGFDPVAFSLNGDPEALGYWRSRVGSNCCLWNYADIVLRRWYPTMPAGLRVGDPDGMEERCRLWWERWKDRLRWSRLADGWVPSGGE
jgi:hypothetical protein